MSIRRGRAFCNLREMYLPKTLFLCTEYIKNILNTQSRSYELKWSQHRETHKQLRMRANKDRPYYLINNQFVNFVTFYMRFKWIARFFGIFYARILLMLFHFKFINALSNIQSIFIIFSWNATIHNC